MNAMQSINLAACIGQLAVAALCIHRSARSPLAVPLALLCLDVFVWTGAALAFELSDTTPWRWVDHAATPWTAPLALQFVLVFTGRRRALQRALAISAVPAAALSGASVAAFFAPEAARFIGSTPWSIALLGTALPTMAFAMVVLARHLRETSDVVERARSRLLLTGLAVGTVMGAIDELGRFLGVHGAGGVGMLATSVLLAVVALRFRLFDADVSIRALVLSFVVVGGGSSLAIAIVRSTRVHLALLLLGAATIALASFAVARRWIAQEAERRARRDELTTMGRFSAQMAHDLKNPLAALKGAAQLLREDLTRPTTGFDRVKFTDLMLDQIERLDALLDDYGRLGRVEPNREPVDLNAEVRAVLALRGRDDVHVETILAEPLPSCSADRSMLARVVENLVRNAVEATPGRGKVVVRTALAPDSATREVDMSIEDSGCGMDARTRERAFDDFFTTKPTGSGLGLAFVRRVVEAHGGRVHLSSEVGRGTVVRVRLPSQ